jgi:hypothetical protein
MEGSSRPSVEELIVKAESMKLDVDGVRRAFEHESAPKFADNTSNWLPESESVHTKLLDMLAPFISDGGSVLDLGAGSFSGLHGCSSGLLAHNASGSC